RQMVVGDLGADGAPDVAVGGENAAAGLWTNHSADEEDIPRLTVRYQSTLSAWPPTGASLVGVCGQTSHTRILTRGGKMGGAPAVESYLAWPGCEEDPSITIQWPSGAESIHVVDQGERVLEALEPLWWWMDDSTADVVNVDPALAGAADACVGTDEESTSCCSTLAGDGPCVLPLPEIDEESGAWIQLTDGPALALPRTPPYWDLVTEPSPPRPGEPVTFTVRHGGDPSDFDSAATSIFINGTFLPWANIDEEARTLSATWYEPLLTPDLDISLMPLNLPPAPTWTIPTGWVLDTRWAVVDVYPSHVLGGITELWNWTVHVTGYRGMKYMEAMEQLTLTRADGTPIDTQLILEGSTVSRMRMTAPWDQLEGLDTVYLRDGILSAGIPLPVMPALSLEEAATAI
ncbi:MAG: hypothetical protein VX938_00630, partial [Myxococcota bacterium]|nr:hypothetical protein [Myxococcota bacterium]